MGVLYEREFFQLYSLLVFVYCVGYLVVGCRMMELEEKGIKEWVF